MEDTCLYLLHYDRGLDSSGKTTIVKSLMKENVLDVEPTFGFNIKTLPYKKQAIHSYAQSIPNSHFVYSYVFMVYLQISDSLMGCRWPGLAAAVLEKLLRGHRWLGVGS